MTSDQPKCYVPVAGQRIMDWTLRAFAEAGLHDPVFIGGYQIDRIRADYPHLTFCHNADWQNNNILLSLFHAEAHMDDGFVCAYSDILFRPSVVRRATEHPGDIVLCVDTHWRQRYQSRTQHPEQDAEKVIAHGDQVQRIHRAISGEQASGEYIGVAKFTPRGAALLREHYHRARVEYAGRPWREAKVFEKAYLILLFQQMIESGVDVRMVATHGDYFEIDTEEDYALANQTWSHPAAQDDPATQQKE
jgi:choline kinase